MTFREKLVILRKIKGITQEEFACAVGVSRQAVYKWESGQSYPEVPKLLEMNMPVSSTEGASTVAVCVATVESTRSGKPVDIKYPF